VPPASGARDEATGERLDDLATVDCAVMNRFTAVRA